MNAQTKRTDFVANQFSEHGHPLIACSDLLGLAPRPISNHEHARAQAATLEAALRAKRTPSAHPDAATNL